nr:unnamed protein product [Naegleria fowleri]
MSKANNSSTQAKKPQQKKVAKKVKKTLANPFSPKFKILSSEQQNKVLKLISEIISSPQSHQIELVIFPDANYLQINPIQIDFLINQCSYAKIPFINLEINVQSFTEVCKKHYSSLSLHPNNFLKAIAFESTHDDTSMDPQQSQYNILELLYQENVYGPSIPREDLFYVPPFISSSFQYEPAHVEDVKPLNPIKKV